MKSFVRISAAAALAAASVTAAQAKVPTADEVAKMSDDELVTAIDRTKLGDDSGCRMAAYYTELARRRPVANIEGVAALMRGYCETFAGKPKQGLADLDTAEGLASVETLRRVGGMLDAIAVLAAVQANDFDAFAEHARHIAGRDSAEEFARQQPEIYRYGMFRAKQAQADSVALAFVRAKAFESLPDEIRTILSGRAVGAALRAKDLVLAQKMAAEGDDPPSYVDMLVDREYEPLWPFLAARAGPHLTTVLSRNEAAAAKALDAAPGDHARIKDEARALLLAGDYKGVVATAAALDHTKRGIARMDEDAGWTLNAEVKALDRLGRSADADKLFDDIAALDPKGRGWLVNFVINRADRLVGRGRWAEALPAAELAVKISATQGSPYAKEVAASDRYCAAAKSDPSRDLSAWWAQIDANWIENIGAAVQAAQCKGDTAAARRYLRDGLKDADHRHSVLMLLQPKAVDFYRDEANMFEEPRHYLSSDSKLKELYEKYGRDLPEDLIPRG